VLGCQVTDATAEGVGVSVAVTDTVMTVTLNRPDKGNSLRQAECQSLLASIRPIDGGGPVRAVLIRGDGRNFCSGADLVAANAGETKYATGHLTRSLKAGAHGMISALWNCPVPTVSAVQGKAMGLGLHLAIACDFVVAANDATFTEPFCQRGFSVDSGGSFLLPRLIGVRRARQMLYRGTTVDAFTALEWGLVDQVVGGPALEAMGAALASELAAGPTYSLGHTKRMLNGPPQATIDTALTQEVASVEATVRSADFKEGLRAFAERRGPAFTGQ
jgi:2-(1,2-epoxy-1,2-dihydrophenyl)acetyl-CoA isomerase